MFVNVPTRRRGTYVYIVSYQDANTAGITTIVDTTPRLAAYHVARSLGYQCKQRFQNATYNYLYDLQKPHPPLKHGLRLQVVNQQTGKVKIYCVAN